MSYYYKGQVCVAGSRIFVQEGIYDEFLSKFTATAAYLASKTGDPFDQGIEHGPQVSKVQFDVRPSFDFDWLCFSFLTQLSLSHTHI